MKKLASLFFAARLYILFAPTVIGFTGAAMNQAVLAANGGKFPVMVNDEAARFEFRVNERGFMDDTHCRMTGDTRLNFLADYINLRTIILSPGDLLLILADTLGAYTSVVWITLAIADYAVI